MTRNGKRGITREAPRPPCCHWTHTDLASSAKDPRATCCWDMANRGLGVRWHLGAGQSRQTTGQLRQEGNQHGLRASVMAGNHFATVIKLFVRFM